MNYRAIVGVALALFVVVAVAAKEKERDVLPLEESKLPDLRPSATSDPRSSNNLLTAAARSVNLSFFIPAFSLFALASQLMPQMFPSLTTATTSSRSFPGRGIPRRSRFSKKRVVNNGAGSR